MRQLKHHEKKLLRKVDYYDWSKNNKSASGNNIREIQVTKKFMLQQREDYSRYQALAKRVEGVVHMLRQLPSNDADRIRLSQILLAKLYHLGLIPSASSLENCEKMTVSHLASRRLPVVMKTLKFTRTIAEAVKFIEQGHVAIGPQVVSNTAMHVTREMEDHIKWAEGSSIKRHVEDFAGRRDDFDLRNL